MHSGTRSPPFLFCFFFPSRVVYLFFSFYRKFRHPLIARVYAISIQDNYSFIVMEHCKFGSLADVLRQARSSQRGIPLHRRLQIASDIACAMSFLHNQSPPIFHSALTSSNVLVMTEKTYSSLLYYFFTVPSL